MSCGSVVSKFVVSQIALSSAPFSADGGYSFQIPTVEGLVDAAQTQKVIFVTNWVLVYIFAHNMEQTE
jgi:hypothetical protein